jgi:uroporphyrinogen-III synthase
VTRVVVCTLAAGALDGLEQALPQVEVRRRPLLEFLPPPSWGPLDGALARLGQYAAVVLTSPRAAAALGERLRLRGPAAPESGAPDVWLSGSATGAHLGDTRNYLGAVRTVGMERGRGAAQSLARAMLGAGARDPILFPCGERRREELVDILRAAGVRIDAIVCYRSRTASADEARTAVRDAAAIVVGSPSIAELLARAFGGDARPALIAIGPTTADSARASGWRPAAVAEQPTPAAVAAAVLGVLPATGVPPTDSPSTSR